MAVLLGLVLGGPTWAEETNWQLFGTNAETGISLYYDTESIKYPSKGLGRVWVKTVPRDEQGRKGLMRGKEKATNRSYENFSYTLNLYEIKCSEKKYRITVVVDYEKEGKIIQSSQHLSEKWNPVTLESMVGFLYMEVVCP